MAASRTNRTESAPNAPHWAPIQRGSRSTSVASQLRIKPAAATCSSRPPFQKAPPQTTNVIVNPTQGGRAWPCKGKRKDPRQEPRVQSARPPHGAERNSRRREEPAATGGQ